MEARSETRRSKISIRARARAHPSVPFRGEPISRAICCFWSSSSRLRSANCWVTSELSFQERLSRPRNSGINHSAATSNDTLSLTSRSDSPRIEATLRVKSLGVKRVSSLVRT